MPNSPPRPDPAIVKGVIPYLAVAGIAAEAAAFYARAFGARDVARVPLDGAPGRLLHCHIEINGGSLMMSDWGWDADHPPHRSCPMTLQLVVSDGDMWWSRAVDAGCEIVEPLQRMFWGDRYGRLRDPYGIEWAINAVDGEG